MRVELKYEMGKRITELHVVFTTNNPDDSIDFLNEILYTIKKIESKEGGED